LQRQLSSAEFAELWAEETIEPRGPYRGDLQAAIVARVIAEVNRDKAKRPQPYNHHDFTLKFEPPEPKEMTWAQMKTVAMELTKTMGGKIINADNR